MSHYAILLTVHLFAAIMFVGTVFFEVLMLEGIRKRVPHDVMKTMEKAIGNRARKIMPWVLLALYLAGVGMAITHANILKHPFSSSFGFMLSIKIILAISVFIHFITAMTLHHKRKMRSIHFKAIHISVFCHVILIVFLAKAMFYMHL